MSADDPLAPVTLLADLPTRRRAELAAAAAWLDAAPGEEIVGHLEASDDVFLIVAGDVRVAVHTADGRRIDYRDLGQGQQFGELAALDAGPRSASVEALTPVRLARLPRDTFLRILDTEPTVARRLLGQLAALIRRLSERLYEVSATPVRARVRAEVLRMALMAGVEEDTATIRQPPTHESIAAKTSTHREAVSREIAALRREGVLQGRGRHWTVRGVSRLADDVSAAVGLPVDEVRRI